MSERLSLLRITGLREADIDDCMKICRAALAGHSPFEQGRAIATLRRLLARQPSAICAIDVAISDLLGKMAGLPLRDMWGMRVAQAETAISLGVSNADELLARVQKCRSWPILKIKMTRDSQVEVLKSVRSIYKGRIWIDGNGCWDTDDAIRIGRRLEEFEVELFEQPIPPGQPDQLARVRASIRIPLVADQDSVSLSDCVTLSECVDVVTIKIHRCGGLLAARDMAALAHGLGLKVMMGCITENCINISAAAQLAAVADFLDLDGHLDLKGDPWQGLRVVQGRLVFPETPGIGVTKGGDCDGLDK